jgi:hypothetical protein
MTGGRQAAGKCCDIGPGRQLNRPFEQLRLVVVRP